MNTEQIVYEEAAEFVTVQGWQCKRCERFYGTEEHLARWCCASDMPCECGGRNLEKGYTHCGTCRAQRAAEKIRELYEKAIDGWHENPTWPVYSEQAAQFFFDADELLEWIAEQMTPVEHDNPEIAEMLQKHIEEVAGQIMLRLCTPNNGRVFDVIDFLYDDLPEEGDAYVIEKDAPEINKIVNEWIAARAPLSWNADGRMIKISSVVQFWETNK